MKVYLVSQKVGIFGISEPTVQGLLTALFDVGRALNWDGTKYEVAARKQNKNGDIFFYLSER